MENNYRSLTAWYLLTLLFAGFVYFYGLGSDHLATNGDELVYAQIARATAQSGHWLPLQSPIARLQNTKPPLLFWQGMLSSDFSKNWTLWNLRYPNVIYTLLTSFLLFLLGKRLTQRANRPLAELAAGDAEQGVDEAQQRRVYGNTRAASIGATQLCPSAVELSKPSDIGLLAGLIFLCFFGTFRYGRCFLTSAPEVFWFFLPFFLLLQWPKLFKSWSIVPLFGIFVGIGLLYKSCALLAPIALGLSWWHLQEEGYSWSSWLRRDVLKIITLSTIALGVFSLWFFLDPQPLAIFHDFIIRENLGKFDAGSSNYLINFFIGGSSIWRNLIAYPFNAGLLGPAVVFLFFKSYLRRKQLSDAEQLLWIWIITVFVVFSFPNQRDERYLLIAMPAIALLLALQWNDLPRSIFALTLFAVGVITGGLAGLALLLQHHLASATWDFYHYPITYWLVIGMTLALVFIGLWRPSTTSALICPCILMLYFCYAFFLKPFDGPLGTFNQEARDAIRDKRIWVPTNFNAREESYRFLLPESKALIPYDYKATISIADMQAKVPRFIVSLPLTNTTSNNLQGAQLLGRRLNLIDRFNAQETQAILQGDIAKYLFHQDLLVERQ